VETHFTDDAYGDDLVKIEYSLCQTIVYCIC
jgi:hypothetical protein